MHFIFGLYVDVVNMLKFASFPGIRQISQIFYVVFSSLIFSKAAGAVKLDNIIFASSQMKCICARAVGILMYFYFVNIN